MGPDLVGRPAAADRAAPITPPMLQPHATMHPRPPAYRRRRRRHPRRSNAGFTLLELLVTITVGILLLMLARPGLNSMRANMVQYEATNRLAHALRLAQNDAERTGFAHLVRVRGGVTVAKGMHKSCRLMPWARAPGCNEPWQILADTSYEGALIYEVDTDGEVDGTNFATAGDVDVCFEPSGKSYLITNPDDATPTIARLAEPLVFRVLRADGRGEPRYLLMPPGGLARPRMQPSAGGT